MEARGEPLKCFCSGRAPIAASPAEMNDHLHSVRAAEFHFEDPRRKRRDDPFFRTEVHLREGGQVYDVMDWRKDELIHDVLDEYQRHMHSLSIVR